jgi:hypothetical protein
MKLSRQYKTVYNLNCCEGANSGGHAVMMILGGSPSDERYTYGEYVFGAGSG